ncbi:MAG: hypothetical protein ACRDZR_16805 [Acidimicrobiales bacterium]
MEPRIVHDERPAEHDAADEGVVAFGDEHDRGVESLCVGEAA